MLFLALKKVEMIKITFLRFPPHNEKIPQQNFLLPPLGGFPPSHLLQVSWLKKGGSLQKGGFQIRQFFSEVELLQHQQKID